MMFSNQQAQIEKHLVRWIGQGYFIVPSSNSIGIVIEEKFAKPNTETELKSLSNVLLI